MLQPSPDNNSSTFNCSCSLCQYGGISRWSLRRTGTLTKFLRLGSPPSSVVPSSILCQPLLYDVIPDPGQVVSSTVSVKLRFRGPDVNCLLHSPFRPLVFHGQYLHVLQHDGVVGAVCMHICFETSDVVELSLLCSPNLVV